MIKQKELTDNKSYTKGKVVDYYYVGAKRYIKYVFFVNKRKYEGETRVYSFKCSNGVGGCVGEVFTIIYSSVDPTNNEIDLGKYNKNRPMRVRFF